MSEETEELKHVRDKVEQARSDYNRTRSKKWVYTGFCGIVGLMIGFAIPYGV